MLDTADAGRFRIFRQGKQNVEKGTNFKSLLRWRFTSTFRMVTNPLFMTSCTNIDILFMQRKGNACLLNRRWQNT